MHSEAFYGATIFFKHHPIQFQDYIWGPHTVAEARLHAPIAVSAIRMLTVGLVNSSPLIGALPSSESHDEKSVLFPSQIPDWEAAR